MNTDVAKGLAAETDVKLPDFLALADKVIGLANHSSTDMPRAAVHLAFLYAVSRYGVFVWQAKPAGKDGNEFIADMVKRYDAMLHEQLDDPSLKNRPVSP